MATLKIIIVVICLFIHFDYFSAETSCYTATTKEHCLAIGKCQIVTVNSLIITHYSGVTTKDLRNN